MRSSSSAPPATWPTRRSSPRCRRWCGAATRHADHRRGAAPAGRSTSCASVRATASSSTAASTRDAFAKLCVAAALRRRRLPRPGDVRRLRAGARRRASGRCTTSRFRRACSHRRAGPGAGRLRRRTRASIVEKPFGRDSPRRRSSTARCTRSSPSRRCSASTTTSARRRCRTCCISASPTRSSSRSGIATTSTSVQITMAESFGVAGPRRASTRRSARSATWCRTTCCR